MWVTFERDQHMHFANTTNNRLESHNQKLKDLTSRSSSLSDMFQNMLLYARTSAAEYSQKSFTEEFTAQSGGDSDTLTAQAVRSACTQYAAEMILEQLKLAESIPYEFSTSETQTVVKYKDRSHFVSVTDHSCSCSFRKTLQMPCRHLLAARTHNGTTTFEPFLVAERWLKQYQLHVGVKPATDSDHELVADSGSHFEQHEVVVSTLPPSSKVSGTLAKNQKYRKMLFLSQRIAVVASECGMPEFRRMYSTVESLLNYWERNIPVTLTPVSDEVSVNFKCDQVYICCV